MNTKYLSSLSLFRLFIIFTTINNTFFSNIQQYLSHLVFCQKLMIHSSLITWMKSYLLPIKSIMVALFIYKLRKKNLFQKFPRIIWLLHQQKPSSNVKEITWMKSYNTFFSSGYTMFAIFPLEHAYGKQQLQPIISWNGLKTNITMLHNLFIINYFR